jgi:hypothetical protein
MKKISMLTSIILFSFSLVSAQGNLQFNQVLTFTGYMTSSCPQAYCTATASSPIWVVPQNKVWKIEYKSRTDGGGARFYLNAVSMVDLWDRITSGGSWGFTSTAVDNAPLWLKANDEIHFQASAPGNNGGASVNHPYIISIIEYNIVP